jgi:YesN/AraC family two-component response regulator
MYSLLVSAHDQFSITTITKITNWKKVNIDEVFESKRIDDAIKIAEDNAIDIFIFDMDMSADDMLMLLKWLQESKNLSKTILIVKEEQYQSLVKTFEYQKVHIIQKPIKEVDIIYQIDKIHNMIEVEKGSVCKTSLSDIFEKGWDENKQKFTEEFIKEIIFEKGRYFSKDINRCFASYDMKITENNKLLPMLFTKVNYESDSFKRVTNIRDDELIMENLKYYAKSLMFKKADGCVLSIEDYLIAVFFIDLTNTEQISDIKKRVKLFINSSRSKYNQVLTCFLGNNITYKYLGNEVFKLKSIAQGHTGLKSGIVKIQDIDSKTLLNIQKPEFKKWGNLLNHGEYDILKESVDDYFNTLRRKGANLELVQQIYFGVVSIIYNNIISHGLSVSSVFEGEDIINKKIEMWSIANLKEWMLKSFKKCIDFLQSRNALKSGIYIRIKNIMKINRGKNLSIELFERELGINGHYISKVFKDIEGRTLSEYIHLLEEKIK